MKNNRKLLKESPLSVASRNTEANVLKLLNPQREPLTAEVLKSFPAYEHLSSEKAEAKCASIRTLARLLFEHLACVENPILIENQHVISLDNNQDNKIVAINTNKTKSKAA